MATPAEKREELRVKREELHALFAKYGDEWATKMPRDEAETIAPRNEEITKLAKEMEDLEAKDAIRRGVADAVSGERGGRGGQPAAIRDRGDADGSAERKARKSYGEEFGESEEYKAWRRGGSGQRATVEFPEEYGLKATFDTAAATLTNYDRQPGFVMVGTQRPTVAGLFAQGQTTANTIRYPREDTITNAATAVAEGATKPEASFDTSEVDAPVKKLAVTAKVSDETFADFPQLRTYIDNRLRWMIADVEDSQLLTGNGVGANITGVLNTGGIQTYALAAEPVPDAVYKALVKIMTIGFFQPDGVVMNPLDWQDIRLLRTADGLYIWGSPMDTGAERIWGLPVVLTTRMTQNTALVGAFQLGGQVFYRQGITVEATNSNEDDFKKNLIALRAEQREALVIYRPKAFCTVTGV